MENWNSDSEDELYSPSESVDRRIEFNDGHVVFLPNEMEDHRVRQILSSSNDLMFYHRYNAGDICLGPGEDHWLALGRRSEGTRFILTSLHMNRLSAAIRSENWEAARESMRAILDVDPQNRRSPLGWRTPNTEYHRFQYTHIEPAQDRQNGQVEDDDWAIPEAPYRNYFNVHQENDWEEPETVNQQDSAWNVEGNNPFLSQATPLNQEERNLYAYFQVKEEAEEDVEH